MKKNFDKKTFSLFLVLTVAAAAATDPVLAASLKNNISVLAETGGNAGSSVQTGSASASSVVTTQLSGDNSSKVSTNIQVQANGVKKEVQSNSPGSVSVQVQDQGAQGQATVAVEKNLNNNLQGQAMDAPALKKDLPAATPEKNQTFLFKTAHFFQSIGNWLKNIF